MKGCFGFRPSPGVDFPTPLDAIEAAGTTSFASSKFVFLATRVENQRAGRLPGAGPWARLAAVLAAPFGSAVRRVSVGAPQNRQTANCGGLAHPHAPNTRAGIS